MSESPSNYRAVPEDRVGARIMHCWATVEQPAAGHHEPAESTARCTSRGLVAGVTGLFFAAVASTVISWKASTRYSETHVPVYSDSGEMRGVWVLHAGLTCEAGLGASAAPRSSPGTVRLGLEACRALCESQEGCDGIARSRGASQGGCGLRWQVNTDQCVEDAGRDFWHLWRTGRGADAPGAEVDGLPAEQAAGRPRPPGGAVLGPTVRPGVPDLPDVVFDDSVVEDLGNGGSAGGAAAAGELEWKLHPGVLCKPSDETLDGELSGSLMQCREACLQEPRCEAMQTLSGKLFGKCRMIGGVDMTMCTEDPQYDLWRQVDKGQGNMWQFRPVDGGRGRQCQGGGVEFQNGPDEFTLHSGASLDECKDLCRAAQECQGIQHESASARCKVWTTAVRTSAALEGAECLAYEDAQLLPRAAKVSSTTVTTATATTATTTTTTTRDTCPACAPKEHKPPAIVIPTFERDLCKMKFTAKSISRHDPNHYLGDVHIAWVTSEPSSNYANEIDEIRSIVEETRGFHIHDFSQNLDGKAGWFAQQIFKLKIAQLLTEEFYVVLDSKNTFIRDVEANSFFSPCHQAYNFAQYTMDQVPDPHVQWYHKSAEALHLDINQAGDTLWPASITPMTMHRQSVLDMLESIGEDPNPYSICGGPLCGMMESGVTEFTAYQLYAHFVKEFECIHETSPSEQEIAISLWRGYDGSFGMLEKVASKELRPTIFGSQASALDNLPQEQKERVPGLISQVFRDAGLDAEEEQIADCIIRYQDR